MPHADLEHAIALRDRDGDGNVRTSSRWTIRNHTGGWWTSWRPGMLSPFPFYNADGICIVIHVELFAPIVAPPPPHPGGDDFVPAYSPRQAEGERVIQFSV